MNQLWLQIFAVMIGGSIVKSFVHHPIFWVVVDVAVLVIAYIILRRHSYYIDLKKSMTFLGALTAINVIVDFGVVSADIGNIAVLGLLAYWIFWGQKR